VGIGAAAGFVDCYCKATNAALIRIAFLYSLLLTFFTAFFSAIASPFVTLWFS